MPKLYFLTNWPQKTFSFDFFGVVSKQSNFLTSKLFCWWRQKFRNHWTPSGCCIQACSGGSRARHWRWGQGAARRTFGCWGPSAQARTWGSNRLDRGRTPGMGHSTTSWKKLPSSSTLTRGVLFNFNMSRNDALHRFVRQLKQVFLILLKNQETGSKPDGHKNRGSIIYLLFFSKARLLQYISMW